MCLIGLFSLPVDVGELLYVDGVLVGDEIVVDVDIFVERSEEGDVP